MRLLSVVNAEVVVKVVRACFTSRVLPSFTEELNVCLSWMCVCLLPRRHIDGSVFFVFSKVIKYISNIGLFLGS